MKRFEAAKFNRRLLHYTKMPLPELLRHRPHSYWGGLGKTTGLWVSCEGDGDWREFCVGNDFDLESLTLVYQVVLQDTANVLLLTDVVAVREFEDTFFLAENEPNSGYYLTGINWHAVREKYQGIIICPYSGKHLISSVWYNSWDCASGVIWDVTAIKSYRLLSECVDRGAAC